MKNFSKISVALLALIVAFAFIGCGEEPANPGKYDGSGPGIKFKFSSLAIPDGALNDAALAPFNLKTSGSAAVSYADGVLTVDTSACDVGQDYHCLDVLKTAYEAFDAPFEFTVKGKMLSAGALKLGQAGPNGFYAQIKAAGGAMVAGDEFEITATITKANIDGTNGIRIQGSAAPSPSFQVTEILIVK